MSHATPPSIERGMTARPDGLRERKRAATHQRIADEAARLVTDHGLSGTTIEGIAAAAQVGRATFFRYFDNKEIAIAEGFSTPWLTLIIEALEAQPATLGPIEAVLSAFLQFESIVDDDQDTVLKQSQLSQASPGLQAWTLLVFARFEQALAATLAPRFRDLQPEDPRPLMVAAITMASIRTSMDRWLASGATADLAQLIRDSLSCITVNSVEAAPNPTEAAL